MYVSCLRQSSGLSVHIASSLKFLKFAYPILSNWKARNVPLEWIPEPKNSESEFWMYYFGCNKQERPS